MNGFRLFKVGMYDDATHQERHEDHHRKRNQLSDRHHLHRKTCTAPLHAIVLGDKYRITCTGFLSNKSDKHLHKDATSM